MSHNRFAKIVGKITEPGEKCGMAKVTTTGSGSRIVTLEGRTEAVLVVGNVVPEVGELVAWVRLDDGTLITAKNLQAYFPFIAGGVFRKWEEILIKDYTGISTGSTSNQPYGLWQDSWGNWWTGAVWWNSSSGYHADLLRGDWETTPWVIKSTLNEFAWIVGHGNKAWAVYRPAAGGYPTLRSREATIAEDGTITWGSEVNLPDDTPAIVEARFLHMIRDPNGHLWVYNAPRRSGGTNYAIYIWKSVLPDSLAGGWTLEYESGTLTSLACGFLVHNGNRCVLLRQAYLSIPDAQMQMRTDADWTSDNASGITGKRFRVVWAFGRWWLSYGKGGSYYASNGVFWRDGGDADIPVWGAEVQLAPAGTSWRIIVPYADDVGVAVIWGTGTQLTRGDLPDDLQEEEWPRTYVGTFPDSHGNGFPSAVEPGEEGTLALQDGIRIWGARMVE